MGRSVRASAGRWNGSGRVLRFIRQNRVLSLAFGLALLASAVFLFRFTAGVIYWADPRHVDQPVAGWMTPRYVARSWSVPPEVVDTALGLAPGKKGGGRPTLDRIAQEQGRDVHELSAEVYEAIEAYRDRPDG